MQETVLIIVGVVVGVVAFDFIHRLSAMKRIAKAEQDLKDSIQKLSDLHNSATLANQELQNKVQSLELAYKSAANPVAVKRFS